MRIPTSETNDTLDAASLPPTEGTELNYRTRPDVETGVFVKAKKKLRMLMLGHP